MDLEPLFTNILVKRKEVRQVGRIIVPDGSREMQATEGEVIATGGAVEAIRVGDTVFFGRYAGAEIEREGTKYVLMREEDVLCKVKIATYNA